MWGGALEDLRVFPNFGQDLYVRLAAADLVRQDGRKRAPELDRDNEHLFCAISKNAPSKSDKKAHVIIAVAVSICVLAAIIALAGFFWWRRKRARARQSVGAPSKWSGVLHSRTLTSEGTSHGADLDLPIYDLETIAEATQGFSTDNKLGEGGYGPVYKGTLEDGQEIAVKTLSQASTQGPDEFKNEVMLIAKLQHRNLVRLIGCCICGQEKILIYEYMANKSLDFFLFDKSKSMLLDWQTRYRIIEGIARGLLYLHQDSRYRIVHRDLKTSNILLDKDMTPKISDFGMARIFGGDDSEINTLRVVGTYGYMAPEYAMDGVFSVKSDVFSFGVIVLEIITGIRNRGVYSYSSHLNLLAHAWSLLSEGKSLELVDETLKGTFESEEVVKCLKRKEINGWVMSVEVVRETLPTAPSPPAMGGARRTRRRPRVPKPAPAGGICVPRDGAPPFSFATEEIPALLWARARKAVAHGPGLREHMEGSGGGDNDGGSWLHDGGWQWLTTSQWRAGVTHGFTTEGGGDSRLHAEVVLVGRLVDGVGGELVLRECCLETCGGTLFTGVQRLLRGELSDLRLAADSLRRCPEHVLQLVEAVPPLAPVAAGEGAVLVRLLMAPRFDGVAAGAAGLHVVPALARRRLAAVPRPRPALSLDMAALVVAKKRWRRG
ncbi:unnamed protein product [Triticum turgidum subsp. durum]|uniref:non-specific serine/threonine protein kinase n=1 Tax=Triticum turgidum subsp. durum TaxID=4567 RepID=A0A9R0UZR9_TRITD|nr:unnamed protein product [Triticum turgidum subsp. durum]